MNKKLCVLVVTLLMCLSAIMIIPRDFEVKAAEGGDESVNDDIGLDYNYMWNVTKDLAEVIRVAYNDTDVPMGRAFATKGDNYTAEHILRYQMNLMGLENVLKIPLGPVKDEKYKKWYYTNKFEVNGCQLIINGGYPFGNNIPITEFFPIPSACKTNSTWRGTFDHNYTFPNCRVNITPSDFGSNSQIYPLGGSYTGDYLNVSVTQVNNLSGIVGNVTYIDTNSTLPEQQEGQLFIMDEGQGCQDKLDNVTNATGVVLIYDSAKGSHYVNSTSCSAPVVRVELTEDNITEIKEMLQDGMWMIADDYVDESTLTFTYNLSKGKWFNHNFVILDNLSGGGSDNLKITYFKTLFWWSLNDAQQILTGDCWLRGVVVYEPSLNNTHIMLYSTRDWPGYTYNRKPTGMTEISPALPIFSVSKSVGEWLYDNRLSPDCTVGGYIDQQYIKESHSGDPQYWTTGVDAYNVIGNITIEKSPGDAIVIISNRYDGWWGETPGDSGAGAGIVLGIAKYFKDYNIKPKYNLSFLFTTGEEYGCRGAYHYRDSHPNDNVTLWIGTDQLGFNKTDSTLCPSTYNTTNRAIIQTIADLTRYESRTGYSFKPDYIDNKSIYTGTEAEVWINDNHTKDAICFEKNGSWMQTNWHRTGLNYTEGDSMKNEDRNDLNVTFELMWNVTKYFCVDPDCWFSDVTFRAIDSPNDGDTLNDSILVNFTINTSISNDLVRVVANVTQYYGDFPNPINYSLYKEYTVTSRGLNESWAIPIADIIDNGNCSVQLNLFNSTGRINKIAFWTDQYNDTSDASQFFHLYHPFGYPTIGELYKSAENNITGSVFTANQVGTVDNITAYIKTSSFANPPGTPTYKCMIYRANDSKLIGNSTAWTPDKGVVLTQQWVTFNFTEPKPVVDKDTDYILTIWSDKSNSRIYYDDFSFQRGRYNRTTYSGTPPSYPCFTNESRIYSIYCSYAPDKTPPQISSVTSSPHTVGFGYNVNISASVTDDASGVDAVKTNITYPDHTYGNCTMTNTAGSTYKYAFDDTWQFGQYNYTIWTVDNAGNGNRSTNHHFHVAGEATISAATIKSDLDAGEYINLTDPPNNDPLWTENADGFDGINLNYENAWDLLQNHIIFTLEKYTNTGWQEIDGLTVTYQDESENAKKHTWEFDSTQTTNYRIHATIDLPTTSYEYDATNHTFILVYEAEGYPIIVRYDYTDLLNIPNLVFNYNTDDNQWQFTTETGIIQSGKHVTLDPTITIESSVGTDASYTGAKRKLVRSYDGTLYCAYIKNRGDKIRKNQINYAKSTNNGSSWTTGYITKNSSYDQYHPTLLIDSNNTLHAIWAGRHSGSTTNYQIRYSRSTNNGTTWSQPVNLTTGASYLQECASSIIDDDNNMYIVWGGNYAPSGVGSHYQIRFSKSTNGGISWAQPTNITSELYDQGNPALAINDTGGLHLTWQGYTSTYTSYNQIRYKKSANLGASWSQTINLTAQSYNSYYVSIICNKSGSPWIAYAARAAAHPSYERIKSRHSRDGVTWSAIVDLDTYASAQGYPSLSSNNNSIVCIWRGRSSSSPSYKQIRKAEYTTSWSATTDLTSGNTHKEYPTTIWANFPNISRLEMDVPKAGYALIYVDNTTLKYMTNGLIWNDFVQSKIVNLGLTDIQGYLLIQVQYLDDSHLPGGWVVDNETVNETSPRIILSGQQLALDTIFNGLINTNDLKHGDGKYRIYAAFRDNRNSPLQLSSENSLTAYWEFDVDI